MGATNNDEAVSPARIREVLSHWFQERHPTAVRFIENTKPDNEPYADYIVAYKAVFEPNALDKAFIEIGVTEDGAIAIGFETKNRIAERLGIKSDHRKRFAAGHEPSQVTEQGLLAVLTLVSEGRIAISASCLPLLGLTGTEAVLLSDADEFLATQGYDDREWLKVVADFESAEFTHLLRFLPW